MSAVQPSSSPRWDSRNSSFVPPVPFQQLRQPQPQASLGTGMPTNLAPQRQPSQDNAPLTTTHNHSRSASFFSFRSNRPSNENQPPQRSLSTIRQGSFSGPALDDWGRPIQQSGPNKLRTQNGSVSQPTVKSPLEVATQGLKMSEPKPLHPEIRSIVQLNIAHAHKIYFSGPLVRRIERQPDGQRPAKDEGWTDVWGQLGGTTLSIWDMKQIEEASKQGKEVPPTYVNITDAVRSCPSVCALLTQRCSSSKSSDQ
jgi:CCR4-NOT transcriptional complex subunit CAF120